MAAGDAGRFAALCEFGGGVSASGVEQPVVCRYVDDGRGYQGLCSQVHDRLDNNCLFFLYSRGSWEFSSCKRWPLTKLRRGPERTGIPVRTEHWCNCCVVEESRAKDPSPRRSLRTGARLGEGPEWLGPSQSEGSNPCSSNLPIPNS